jgi:Ca2+:H+ antiporter
MSAPAVRDRMQWSVVLPVLAFLVLGATWFWHDHWAVIAVVAIALTGAVVAAVHHAEVVAHKVALRSSA